MQHLVEQDFEVYIGRQLYELRGRLVSEYRRQVGVVPSPPTSKGRVNAKKWSAPAGLPAVLHGEGFGEESTRVISLDEESSSPRCQEELRIPTNSTRHSTSRLKVGGETVVDMEECESPSNKFSEQYDRCAQRMSAEGASFDGVLDMNGRCVSGSMTSIGMLGGENAWVKEEMEEEVTRPDSKLSFTGLGSKEGKPKSIRSPTASGQKSGTLNFGMKAANSIQDSVGVASISSENASECFVVLQVWAHCGPQALRKRAFSMRSKSLALEAAQEGGTDSTWKNGDGSGEDSPYSRFIIHPSAMTHLVWDVFGLVLLAYDCIWIPLEVFDFPESPWRSLMAWTIRLYWTFNMFKSFITGYLLDDGRVEMRFYHIAVRYTVTWLPLDVAVVLTDWIEVVISEFHVGGFQRFGSALRGLRMLRTARLIRLMKAPEITGFINEQIRSEQILLLATIAKVILIMLSVAHFIACAWFALGKWSGYSNRWIETHGIVRLSKSQQYVSSFHWSLSQFSGELIYAPENGSERTFTVIVLFCATIVSAWFVSSITTSMTQLQNHSNMQTTQFNSLRRYLVDQSISHPLKIRVQRNAQYALLEQKKNVAESSVELLTFISSPLRVELHFEIHWHILKIHPFFLNYYDVNPGGIRKVCHVAVSTMSFHPGDVLFHNLEVPTHKRMYFIVNGDLAYYTEKNVQTLQKGDWLCEAVLWTEWTHCGTCKARTETQMMVLDGDMLQDVIGSFPSEHVAQYARAFVDNLNEDAAANCLTDLNIDEDIMEELIEETFPRDDEEESSDDEEEHRSSRRTSGSVTASAQGNRWFGGGGGSPPSAFAGSRRVSHRKSQDRRNSGQRKSSSFTARNTNSRTKKTLRFSAGLFGLAGGEDKGNTGIGSSGLQLFKRLSRTVAFRASAKVADCPDRHSMSQESSVVDTEDNQSDEEECAKEVSVIPTSSEAGSSHTAKRFLRPEDSIK